MNIEGESLKRIAGSTKGGGLGAVTGWLAARGKDSKGKGGSAPKSGADYHNETLAKMYEHAMSERSKKGAYSRTKGLMKASNQAVKGYKSGDESVDLYNAKTFATSQQFNKQRTSGKAPAAAKTPAAPKAPAKITTRKSGVGKTA